MWSNKLYAITQLAQCDHFRDQSALTDRHRSSPIRCAEFAKWLRTVDYQPKGLVLEGT
jgi:hypothetical protein